MWLPPRAWNPNEERQSMWQPYHPFLGYFRVRTKRGRKSMWLKKPCLLGVFTPLKCNDYHATATGKSGALSCDCQTWVPQGRALP